MNILPSTEKIKGVPFCHSSMIQILYNNANCIICNERVVFDLIKPEIKAIIPRRYQRKETLLSVS